MAFQKLFYESYITLISDINTRKRLWKKWGRWKVKVKVSRSVVLDSAIPWTIACQASLSMEFSRQEYWSGLPTPSPGDLPIPGTDPQSPTLQADSSSFEPPGKPVKIRALKRESESHSVVSNSLWPHGLYSPSNSPGQNIGMGSDSLLQGIFPTRESNQGLLHCRQILYQLSNHGEKAMATHSGTLAWKILWQRSLVGCSPWGRRVGHDWATSLWLFTFMHWRRKWQPTPVFLPGESQGREPGGLPSTGSHRVGHAWSDLAAAAASYQGGTEATSTKNKNRWKSHQQNTSKSNSTIVSYGNQVVYLRSTRLIHHSNITQYDLPY